jgi:hypothetical protein
VEAAMLVVVVSDDVQPIDIKIFEELPDAQRFVQEQLKKGEDDVKIYAVDAKNVEAAKATLEMGEGRLIAAPGHKLSTHELAKLKELAKPRTLTLEEFEKMI